jgi:hypothetical protein
VKYWCVEIFLGVNRCCCIQSWCLGWLSPEKRAHWRLIVCHGHAFHFLSRHHASRHWSGFVSWNFTSIKDSWKREPQLLNEKKKDFKLESFKLFVNDRDLWPGSILRVYKQLTPRTTTLDGIRICQIITAFTGHELKGKNKILYSNLKFSLSKRSSSKTSETW